MSKLLFSAPKVSPQVRVAQINQEIAKLEIERAEIVANQPKAKPADKLRSLGVDQKARRAHG